MKMAFWTSPSLLALCVAFGACASTGSDQTPSNDTSSGSSGSHQLANSSGSSSGSSSPSGSTTSGSSSGGGPTSGISQGPVTGSGADAGTGGEAGATGTEGGTPADDSGAGAPSCTGGHVRGPAPTSASAAAMTGPYMVKSYAADATVRKTNAYDVTSAHIYYPADATPPFAGVAIVPGFVSAESSIATWGPFLASNGILVMTIGTSNPSTGLSDTSVLPNVRSDALEDALKTITGENTRQGGPLVGLVDTARLATAGWSMGGGGTLMAAAAHPENKATMAMAPWNPGGTYPMMTVPTIIFGGTADGLAGPPSPQSQYMSIPATTPKLEYVITGGSHFVANNPAGESGKYDIGRLGLSWMKVFLECDDRYRQFLPVKPSDADTFETTVK